MLTQQTLKHFLIYDPETGVFTARIRRGSCVFVGDIAGFVNARGYRVIKIGQKAYKAHKLAILYMTGIWPEQVDHRNGQKADNRFENLRCADNFINAQNKHHAVSGSASGLIGAHRGGWKGRRWVASICHNGVQTYLGIYQTAEEAHEVYLQAKRALHQGCTI